MEFYWLYEWYEIGGNKKMDLLFENAKTFEQLKYWLIDDTIDIMQNNFGNDKEDYKNKYNWAIILIEIYQADNIHELADYLKDRGFHYIEVNE